MEINKALSICYKNNTKVYPVKCGYGWKVNYIFKGGKAKEFDKVVKQKDLNNALSSSYVYLAKKILK